MDFYEQIPIPKGGLRIDRYIGWMVVMLSRKLIAVLLPYPLLEGRGGANSFSCLEADA